MTKTSKATQTAQETASLETLKGLLTKGSTVYTILRHVSASGMSRRISVLVIEDGRPRDITWHVANVTHYKHHARDQGLVVGGCGMDMGFVVVYDLNSTVFGDGYALRHEWL